VKSSFAFTSSLVLGVLFGNLSSFAAWADDASQPSVQPYIDEVKQEMSESHEQKPTAVATPSSGSSESPFIDSVRPKIKQQESSEGYTERLRQNEVTPPPPTAEVSGQTYIDEQKQKIGPNNTPSAIEAVKNGTSELKEKRLGQITSAFGLTYGAEVNRTVTANSTILGRNFSDVYGANYAPDVTLFYEWQPFHSETWGSLGIVSTLSVSYFTGVGQFAYQLTNPVTGGLFPLASGTNFRFYSIPVSVGLEYQFNLAHYLRPFVSIEPTIIGYLETRDDGARGSGGAVYGLHYQGGVSLLLDWMSSSGSWNLYAEYGIKHFYLTAEYTQLSTLGGDVSYNENGIFAGLTFEY